MTKLALKILTSVLILIIGLPVNAAADSVLLKEVAVEPSNIKFRQFVLTQSGKKFTASSAVVSKWFKTRKDGDQTLLQLRPGAIYDFLNVSVSPQVNDVGQVSRFVRKNGKLEMVGAGRKGSIVDGIKTSLAIREALINGKNTVAVSLKTYRPAIFSEKDFTSLKFPQLLASGESSFAGSPRNRIHNIQIGTSRFDGLVIMPDEQFSFNSYLGEVDAENGYKPELVIKENVTTPEYGGGICQVSTTAFRAALQAGFKINQRRNHSYPVSYYGTPGYDATVYAPYTDLRFTNDTGKPAYLRTRIEGTRVIFEVWGTNDGREVLVNGPFVTAKKSGGALTAAVAQIVKRSGKSIREENFVSNYQSPDKFPTIRAANGE